MKKVFLGICISLIALYSPIVFAGWGGNGSTSSSGWGTSPIVIYPPVELEMFVNGKSAEGNPHQFFNYGNKVKISWKSKNANKCFLHRQDLGVFNQPTWKNATRKVTIKNRHNFYVYCYGKRWNNMIQGNFYSRSVTLFVNPVYPKIQKMGVNETIIQQGEKATISWRTSSTKSCKLNGKAVWKNGNKIVSPTSTTHYTLNCSSKTWNSISKSIHVVVQKKTTQVAPSVTVMPQFRAKANNNYITRGNKVTITWSNKTNVKQCKTLWDNKVVPATGSKTFTPSAWFKWYAIECTFKDWPFPQKQTVPITTK